MVLNTFDLRVHLVKKETRNTYQNSLWNNQILTDSVQWKENSSKIKTKILLKDSTKAKCRE
jgi:hypothetical protein